MFDRGFASCNPEKVKYILRSMPSAAFTTLGCKVNQYETQKILESFAEKGFTIVPFESPADVYVINTCSVTSDAERKSRYTIRRANRHNPEAKVVVTGCATQMGLNKGEPTQDAHVLVPNPAKLDALNYLLRAFPEIGNDLAEPDQSELKLHQGRTRATLKVQDGCSVMCSYCSIPYTRPGMVSRPFSQVLEEAQKLAQLGYNEAILTGVLIGAYGPESGSEGPGFEELVTLLAKESGLARLRISSIEMHQVTDPIIELAQEGIVVPHFHIPLQSGDTGVLRDMNRRYDQKMYIDRCLEIQKRIPDVTLTTDIMVGFPTETHERFQSSVEVCEAVGYHSAHVFTFSPRWGTPADQWGDPVTPAEKSDRRLRLMEVTRRTGESHYRKFLGRTMRVLLESKPGKDGLMQGLTDNYLSVKVAAPASMGRSLVWANLDEFRDGVIHGELAPPPRLDLPALRVLR